jgi:thiamine biosynthesis lipoprotein
MKETRVLMGMPITVEVVGDSPEIKKVINEVFGYFEYVDENFSPFKETSELSRINRGEIPENDWSDDMRVVLMLSEKTKEETGGYFDIIAPDGKINPSGLVKGWAIQNAALILESEGFKDYYVDAGGDIQVSGKNSRGENWKIGVKNPFKQEEIVKVLNVKEEGVATSGTYIRGQHIYDPSNKFKKLEEIVSLTVVGPNIYEADRFATAAFAMGPKGIYFIENLPGFEAYMIDKNGLATETSGFKKYVFQNI